MNLCSCPFPSSMIPYIEQNKQNKVNQNRQKKWEALQQAALDEGTQRGPIKKLITNLDTIRFES